MYFLSSYLVYGSFSLYSFLSLDFKKFLGVRVSVVAQQVKNLDSIHEDMGLILGLTQWVKDLGLL